MCQVFESHKFSTNWQILTISSDIFLLPTIKNSFHATVYSICHTCFVISFYIFPSSSLCELEMCLFCLLVLTNIFNCPKVCLPTPLYLTCLSNLSSFHHTLSTFFLWFHYYNLCSKFITNVLILSAHVQISAPCRNLQTIFCFRFLLL